MMAPPEPAAAPPVLSAMLPEEPPLREEPVRRSRPPVAPDASPTEAMRAPLVEAAPPAALPDATNRAPVAPDTDVPELNSMLPEVTPDTTPFAERRTS